MEQWYQLSDLALEEELKDRLSFRNFVGLDAVQDSPDETTFVRFRQNLQKHNLEETAFNMIRDDLRRNNLEVKQGKCLITDASLVESPYGIESKGRDNNGDFIQRNGEVKKGYKVHLISNQKDNLVETAKLTFASCHESRFLEDTMNKVEGPVSSVLADKGYASDHRKQEYREKGIYYGILEKARINQPLTKKQKKKNKRISRIRSRVERIFAVIKKHYGFSKVRYFGLRNNASHLWYVLAAYNIQHAVLNGP